MKPLKIVLSGAAVFSLMASAVASQTWICDSKARVGFDGLRGYEAIRYSESQSYIIKSGIEKESLSFEDDRNNRVFNEDDEFTIPSSIQVVGDESVFLCRKSILPSSVLPTQEAIFCDGYMESFGQIFSFDLSSGLFSMVTGGYEVGGLSWVEVGECTLID